MSLKFLMPFCEVREPSLTDLEQRLSTFYKNPPPSYYSMANEAAEKYTVDEQPFHCHLASQTFEGARVLELGCGTAHLCPHVERLGGIYHGVDYSKELIRKNRLDFPNAFFWEMSDRPDQKFDIVASLYTIEHVVNPLKYLQQLWDYCRPGGLIGIICPEFIDGEGIPGSVYYGNAPGRIRSKLIRLRLLDVIYHLLDLKIHAPHWKAKARSMAPGAFWMNLDPSDLAGQEHCIDGDAVHFPRLLDLEEWFKQKGAALVATSKTLPSIPPAILRHNCYILVRRSF